MLRKEKGLTFQPEEPDHYRLAPSSAHRWLKCPGSARNFQEETSEAAELGTLAHAYAECLLRFGEPSPEVQKQLDTLPPEVLTEMEECVPFYVDFVNSLVKADVVLIEEKIISEEVNEHGGTIDTMAFTHDTGTIHLVDLKYGKMPVSTKNNPQLMCYLNLARQIYPSAVKFLATIVQPRLNPEPDTCEFSAADLDAFLLDVLIASKSDEMKAGDHCTYCPLLPNCDVATSFFKQIANTQFEDISEEDPEELVRRYEEIVLFKKPATKLIELASKSLVEMAREGVPLSQTKVQYRTSHWRWEDGEKAKEEVEKILDFGGDLVDGEIPEEIMSKPALASPNKVKTFLRKLKVSAELSHLMTRSVIGYKVTPNSERGEAVDFAEGFVDIT